jgi:hypothetical protein
MKERVYPSVDVGCRYIKYRTGIQLIRTDCLLKLSWRDRVLLQIDLLIIKKGRNIRELACRDSKQAHKL